MLQRVRELAGEFECLPLGMRVLAGGVGAGAAAGIARGLLVDDWSQAFVLVGILVAIVLLLWLINVIVRVWSRRKGQGISEALSQRMSEAPPGADGAGAEDSSYARKLLTRWKDVDTRLRERGFDFYSLPWYLVIGASQSGKTTAIQKSDQEFPIGDEPVVEYGGTKNCQWHFTNKAILIDTAGRYLEHYSARESGERVEEDKQEWKRFLSLLLRYRARSPINGLIVAIKVPDILAADPEERIRTAKMIRTALLDVEEQLKVQCPVYILVTMCDRILGFADFFGMLPGLSDRSLFGWSRPGPFDRPFSADELEPGFESIRERLGELRLDFLRERNQSGADDPESRRKLDTLYAFPDEFARTLGPLREMLAQIFAPTTFSEQHFFRGVYFTSGLQMGPPLVQACLDLLGKGDAGLGETQAQGSKAFFIADFFEDKVFKEAGLVRVTRRWNVERQRRERIARIAAGLIGIAATIWVPTEAWKLTGISDKPRASLLAASAEHSGGIGPGSAQLLHLSELRDDIEALRRAGREYYLAGSNVERSAERLRGAYCRLYAERIFRPIVAELLGGIASLPLDTWGDCEKLQGVLLGLHELGAKRSLPEASPSSVVKLVTDLGRLLRGRSRIDLGRAAGLADVAWSETAIGFLASAALEHDQALLDAIHTRILGRRGEGADPSGFWLPWLEALELDAARGLLARKPTRQLQDAWAWDRLAALDSQIRRQLGRLTELAASLELQDIEKVRPDWIAAYDRMLTLREQLRRHLGRLATWEDISREKALEQRRAAFEDLARRVEGSKHSGIAESVNHARQLLERRRRAVEGFVARDAVAVLPREPEKGSAEPAEPRLRDLRLDASASWTELAEWHRVLGRRFELLAELEPREPGFWDSFSRPKACKQRLETWMPKPRDAPMKAELEELLAALRRSTDRIKVGLRAALAKRIETIAEEIRIHLSPAAPRDAASEGESKGPLHGLRRGAARHVQYGFEAARKLTLLVQNVSASDGMRRLRGPLMELAESYYEHGFTPYWEGQIVERQRGLELPDLAEPGDSKGYSAWKRLGDRRRMHFDPDSVKQLVELARLAEREGKQLIEWKLTDRELRARVDDWSESVRKLWKRYAEKDEAGERPALRKLGELGRALARASKELSSIDARLTRDSAVQLLRLAQQHRAALLGPELEQEGPGKVHDPFVGALAANAGVLRTALGKVAGELFDDLWKELGALAAQAEIGRKFPFRDTNERFASWQETERFLGSQVFRDLLDCIWIELPESGRPEKAGPALFDITVPARAGRVGCVRKLAMLRDWFGFAGRNEHRVKIRLHRAKGKKVTPGRWRARVKGKSARFPVGPIQAELELSITGRGHRFVLESVPVGGSSRYRSIHPFECLGREEEDHLNFLAIYYMNEPEDGGARGRRIRFRFPRDAAERQRFEDAGRQLAALEKFPTYMDVWISTVPPLPSELPDFEAAGLGK